MSDQKRVTAASITKALRALGDGKIAEHSQRFFKTGKGQYGEGDVFIGVRVPAVRALVRESRNISLTETEKLLKSKYHEVRLCAALLLVELFQRGDEPQKKSVVELYLRSTCHLNNWDIVDCSAHKVVGPWLENRSRKTLYKFAKSQHLWERRIAIMSTFHFIYQNDFSDTLAIADILLHDSHDLIHKAVGWMLREVGKRDKKIEKNFLKTRYQTMPRTMLRYAIEKFPESERQRYLSGRIT
ncbi:MAG: DNA alkylation repair protein [Pseudomonadota bacterium]